MALVLAFTASAPSTAAAIGVVAGPVAVDRTELVVARDGDRTTITARFRVRTEGRAASLEDARTGARRVWFEDGWRETPVYRRERLPADAALQGPAIVEQLDSTLVLDPGCRAAGDADGNLMIEVPA